ncbi:TPA: replication initiator protein A [Enterococcus faecalis]|nr:replication initiator protein A [Enterococcus faecalis]
MSNFTFIKSERAYETKFFQFPQILLYGDNYKHLSDSAKLGYMVLRDRLDYSLKNNWIDEENNVYFIFTNKELKTLFNWSNDKLNKVKKDLEKAGLLYQKNMGFDPVKRKNIPNRLYLADLEVTAKDVYLKTTESLDTSGNPKIGHRTISTESLDTSGNPKIGHDLYNTITIDTYKDTVIDTTKEELQHRELLQSFSETQEQTFLDKHCLELIALFSNTIQEAHNAVGIIIRAKNKQEKKYGRVLIAEDWQEEIETTLRKVYHKIKTDAKIKNVDNYMFGAFCTTFENCLIQLQSWEQKNESQTVVTLHDWVEKK